jgi:hypothetical protein
MERKLFLTLVFTSILIPWSNALTTLLLVPLAIFSILLHYQKGFRPNYGIIIILSALFLINCISALFQDNKLENLTRVLDQSTLLIVPLLLFGGSFTMSNNNRNKILIGFASSTVVMAATNYLYAIYLNYNQYQGLWSALIEVKYDVFSTALVHHHQLYMGIYLSVSALIFFYLGTRMFTSKKVMFYFIATAIALFFLIVLSVRMALLTTIIALALIVLTLKFPFKLKIRAILSIFFLIAMGYYFNPKLKERIDFLSKFSFEFNYHEDWTYQGLALRLMNWECSWEVGQKNFFHGVGIANVQQELNACYLEKKFDSILFFKKTYGTDFNSHNIYLHTFVASGIFGVLIFTLSIIILLLISLKKRDRFLLIFLFLFFTQGLTESLLYREKGIILFIFFSSILLLPTNPSLSKNNLKIN